MRKLGRKIRIQVRESPKLWIKRNQDEFKW